MKKSKVIIVHDYLFQFGGAEKCLESWLKIYPEAEIYTSFFIPEKFADSELISKAGRENRIKTTWINGLFKIKFFRKFQKHLFWLYPILFAWWRIPKVDLVIISSTFCAKNVNLGQNFKNIFHYCHAPTRFLHGFLSKDDHKTIRPIFRFVTPAVFSVLRYFDVQAAKSLTSRGTVWVANSKFTAQNIHKAYQVSSMVIYPPVELSSFKQIKRQEKPEDFYFTMSRISFHKRTDLVVEACLQLGRRVKIAGGASFPPEMEALQQLVAEYEAKDSSKKGLVEFLGRISDTDRDDYLSRAKAFIFPVKEDFGITPVEAIGAGCPVIAYQEGGTLEYVKQGVNGIFFKPQTVEGLKTGILEFEKQTSWNLQAMRDSVAKFEASVFEEEFKQLTSSIR